ncbi:uncharacterized protein BO97DRAFT_440318 [Aspergillus homomorphus CBS 101889]|uniref:PAC domain-containing protein n=1 Tax=Aspergillus homomorphus (strain CBS 101889) TaxID=1450537 RepID=A0A395IBP2_ASPHC|nr:hypothetical protein BO97DRAFT_440318 [Aspergillus homomorphus CBS 101889]RAL16573.1 hypothetical protein BO97DRAFT_440318 [Aspergillus homomorphus CBS 101889]
MERYTGFMDTESLRSEPSTVALDHYPASPPPEALIAGFPHPPSRARNHDENPNLTPKPSLKTLRRNYMIHDLPLLHEPNPYYNNDTDQQQFHPLHEPGLSYDLIAPAQADDAAPLHSLERLADLMFSSEHMLSILNHPRYLARFREFLLEERPRSLALLTYYLTARKALLAIDYANALVRSVIDAPPATIATPDPVVGQIAHPVLHQRVTEALQALTAEELPAFITARCISLTSRVVEERVRGNLPPKFQGASDALAEVFCLTDPSRRDNPIIFASEEFHRTTQYGMDYVLGRNCRFLQGPKTNPNSVRRLREGIAAGRHHSELFLNYRRDGSPFMNLLQCAPLCDSRGTVRYFIGAQIDVSGLAMDGAQMESLRALQAKQRRAEAKAEEDARDEDSMEIIQPEEGVEEEGGVQVRFDEDSQTLAYPQSHRTFSYEKQQMTPNGHHRSEGEFGSVDGEKDDGEDDRPKDEFRQLTELFSPRELNVTQEVGGTLFHPSAVSTSAGLMDRGSWQAMSRTWSMVEDEAIRERELKESMWRGSLTGVYENYLLVRPYPSLRILFTSPALQIPGMLQSSFLSRIGSTSTVREELLEALKGGRSVTARIKWVTRYNTQGRDRWVHCTPLLASNGEVGVWMVVVVDDD